MLLCQKQPTLSLLARMIKWPDHNTLTCHGVKKKWKRKGKERDNNRANNI